jgi:hypothetical protein
MPPEADLSRQIPYGLDPEGILRHVGEVLRGLKCECTCPKCHRPLVANQGSVKTWYFSHRADTDQAACSGARETAIHLASKQIIAEAKAILLPALVATHQNAQSIAKPATNVGLSNHSIEDRSYPGIVVDVLAQRADDGTSLAIEIRVTHASGDLKQQRLEALALPAFEIDLRNLATNSDADLRRALLHDAKRFWLHHPGQAEADAALANEIEAAEKRYRELAALKEQERLQQLAAQAERERLWYAENRRREEQELLAAEQKRLAKAACEAERERLWQAEATRRREEQERLASEQLSAQRQQRLATEAEKQRAFLALPLAMQIEERCCICGLANPGWGYGPPFSRFGLLWACDTHHNHVDRELTEGRIPQPPNP